MNEQTPLLFSEVQHFSQPFATIIVLVVGGLLVGVFGYGMVQQLVMGKPWGNMGMPDGTLKILGTILILIGLLIPTLYFSANMSTRVSEQGLQIKFFPIHWSWQTVKLEGIKSYEVRTYRPFAEYGGWGIRYGKSGKAYNIAGDQGVQILYKDGHGLLIGSQNSSKLKEALDSLHIRTED